MADAKVRLYVDCPLAAGQGVALTEGQANYLFAVMRLPVGAGVLVFNGRDGEWRATVAEAGKRTGRLICLEPTRPQALPADLWLVFAPVKKDRTHFIVEKAVELGVARLCPVQTRFTNAERLRVDKTRAHVIEAAEQCGATHLAEVAEVQPLDRLLAAWPEGRRILWADETMTAAKATLDGLAPGPWAVLVGPEGGFSEEERSRLRAHPAVTPISLGPRILRAETAAVAALTLWQATLGDWR